MCGCVSNEKYKGECLEVMAVLKWDFKNCNNHHFKGQEELDCAAMADQVSASMCKAFGAGSHWVERENMTLKEKLATDEQ